MAQAWLITNYGDYGTMELVCSIAQSDLLRMNGRALELWKAEAESDSKCFISHDIFAIPQYIPLQDRIAKEDTPSLSLFPPDKMKATNTRTWSF